MKVKIKKLHPDAVVPYKTYEDDFCYDVVAVSCEEIAPNVYKYRLGLAFEIDRKNIDSFLPISCNYEQEYDQMMYQRAIISIDFRPRSSVWKTGMVLSNCEGTVDELYRGEVSAVFYHVFPNMPKYEIGDRIGQMKLGFTLPIEFEEVDKLSESERGARGYGSTGA